MFTGYLFDNGLRICNKHVTLEAGHYGFYPVFYTRGKVVPMALSR